MYTFWSSQLIVYFFSVQEQILHYATSQGNATSFVYFYGSQ